VFEEKFYSDLITTVNTCCFQIAASTRNLLIATFVNSGERSRSVITEFEQFFVRALFNRKEHKEYVKERREGGRETLCVTENQFRFKS
jgi:hypothetical protein